MEKKIAKFPYKIIQPNDKNGSLSFQSNNINYSKKKQTMARNLLDKRYQPPAKGLKDPLFPPINRETRLIVRSVSRRSWKILADRCPNFPRGTPTPTSKSTPTPRTRLYQYRWSRIGASEQGKFQPRRGD